MGSRSLPGWQHHLRVVGGQRSWSAATHPAGLPLKRLASFLPACLPPSRPATVSTWLNLPASSQTKVPASGTPSFLPRASPQHSAAGEVELFSGNQLPCCSMTQILKQSRQHSGENGALKIASLLGDKVPDKLGSWTKDDGFVIQARMSPDLLPLPVDLPLPAMPLWLPYRWHDRCGAEVLTVSWTG